MNKKLLAMAVSTAMFAPVAAQADVKLYGIAQVEYNVEDRDCPGCDSVQSVDDDGGRSRIGVKFTEKLGGGLTAFGKFEWALDPADHASSGASDSLSGRDQFVGIKGSWGSFSAGSHHAPYKTAGGVKWDPWAATHLQARRAGGMTGGAGIGGHNGFMRNSLYYTSPNVNGFQAKFALSPDETNGGAQNGPDDDGDMDWSLAVEYKNGPWHAVVAHNRNNVSDNPAGIAIGLGSANVTTTALGTVTVPTFTTTAVAGSSNDDEDLTKLGLRWKSGPWTLAGQYEDVNDASRAASGNATGGNAYRVCAGCDADVYWLNGQYKAGNNIFTVSYGNTDVDVPGAGGDYDHDYWALGVIHKFSKKTRIFGGYTETDGDNVSPDRDAWTVGIRKDF